MDLCETESLGTASTNGRIVSASNDRRKNEILKEMIIGKQKLKYLEKDSPTSTLSTTSPTWSEMWLNPVHCGEKPLTAQAMTWPSDAGEGILASSSSWGIFGTGWATTGFSRGTIQCRVNQGFYGGIKRSYNRYPYPLLVLHWPNHIEYVSLKSIQIARDMTALIWVSRCCCV